MSKSVQFIKRLPFWTIFNLLSSLCATFFFIRKSFNREFWMEKLRDGRNCLRGCGHSFEIEEKHIFFMTLLTVCCSLFYAISDGPIILKKNSLSDVWRIFGKCYAQSTYFTVRGQSYFSRLPKFWPPIPLSARRVCPPPATKAGGTHSPGGEGDGGVNILEDERNRIALLQ